MPDITCPTYVARADSRRCRYFLDGGFCELASEFHCTEWVKANPHLVPAPPPAAAASPPVAVPTAPDVAASPPRAARELHETIMPVGDRPFALSAPSGAATPSKKPVRHLALVGGRPETPKGQEGAPVAFPSAEDLDAFEREIAEVVLRVGGEDVYLVREKTGQDRKEITFRAARFLADVVAAFPSAEVLAIRTNDDG